MSKNENEHYTMLHTADLKHTARCSRLALLARLNRQSPEGRLHLIEPYSRFWTKKLGYSEVPSTHVGGTAQETQDLLQTHGLVMNARLDWKGLRVKIPLLEQIENGYRATYCYLSSCPGQMEAWTMKVNDEVAAKNGIEITEHQVIYLNRDYVRKSSLDEQEMLIVSNRLSSRKNRPGKTIEEYLAEIDLDLEAEIEKTLQAIGNEQPAVRSKACLGQKKCLYYSHCFDDSALKDDSPVFLTTSQYKYEALEQGIGQIKDLPPEWMEGFALQYAQLQASRMQKPFIDQAGLSAWLQDIQYPVSYLDFEWDVFGIPPYENMKPLDVLCFQYSLHIEEEDGSLRHADFFGRQDCRRDFIQSLIAALPETGTILVFNMEGAEKLRLKQLAFQFPEYEEQLSSICSRMADLSLPFENGLFYDSSQKGHYSLKTLLPIFTNDKSYADLDVQNGLNALSLYRKMEDQDEEAVRALREYCALDTLAEYYVYHGLKDLAERRSYA